MDENIINKCELPKNPNVSSDTSDSDESVIFVKETFNIKYTWAIAQTHSEKSEAIFCTSEEN